MAERRKHPRIRAKFPCDLKLADLSIKATVRDVSAGGLSILGDFEELDQGEPVRIVLYPPGRDEIELACVFWHGRRIRVVGEERWTAHLGFVLSQPSDAYFALVEAIADRALLPLPVLRRPRASDPRRSSERGALARLDPPVLRPFSVRVKEDSGPRTIRIVVAGVDDDDAKARALGEVGCDWIALEARRVFDSKV